MIQASLGQGPLSYLCVSSRRHHAWHLRRLQTMLIYFAYFHGKWKWDPRVCSLSLSLSCQIGICILTGSQVIDVHI